MPLRVNLRHLSLGVPMGVRGVQAGFGPQEGAFSGTLPLNVELVWSSMGMENKPGQRTPQSGGFLRHQVPCLMGKGGS